jgi:hypothetical protein
MEKNNKNKDDNHICRALLTATPDTEGYDFEAVAVPSENGQLRYSYADDEYFMQVLRTGAENIDSSRLDSGLPLFDNHPYDQSAMNTLGITVGYEFTEQGIVIRGKFGSRADEALRNDVKNGIVKTVSIEGSIQNYEVIREEGKVPSYNATLWTPESLSFAPVPNDIGAQIEVKRAIQMQVQKEMNPKPEQSSDDSFMSKLIKKF